MSELRSPREKNKFGGGDEAWSLFRSMIRADSHQGGMHANTTPSYP